MLRFISLSVLFSTALALPDTGGLQAVPTVTAGANILSGTDSGFEPGHAWLNLNGTTIKTTSDQRRSGAQSLAISATGGSQGVNITKPTSWKIGRVRFWVKTSGDPGAYAKAFVYIFDATHLGYSYACGAGINKMSLSGGLANWTEYTLCDEVSESELHYGCNLKYNVYVENLANGVTAYIDDVEFTPVLQPLTVLPTYPNYRGMLWTDQGATIRWAAAVEPTGSYTVADLKVTVDVVRVSDGAVLGTVTNDSLSAIQSSGQWAHFSINWMTYDSPALPNGSYYLRGRLRLKSDESVLYTYPDYKIVKEAPATQRDNWHVWVDKDNRVRFKRGAASAEAQFVHGVYFKNTGGAATMGGADCCNTGDLVADNHRDIKLGCNHATLHVSNVTNASPAVVTVYGHSLSSHDKVTVSGATGSWTGLNGCYYWTGCPTSPGEVEVLGANTFSIPRDTTTFGSFAGQGSVGLVRANCEVDGRDTSFASWNRAMGLAGATVWKQMGNWGMNMTMRYGNWASARSGLSNSTCAYDASVDYVSAYQTALQDLNMWNLQIANSYKSTSPPLSWVSACLSGTEEQKVRYFVNKYVTLMPAGEGFAGFYVADEPSIWGMDSWGNTTQTVNTTYWKIDEHRSLNAGGITFWATTTPGQTNVIWNALVDTHGIDPYPVGSGAIPDDVAAGVGYLAGEKRQGRTWWWTHMLGASVFNSRPYWGVLQLFAVSGSYPALADSKIQAISALAAGVTGILWWQFGTGGLDTRTQADYDNFDRVAKMIADLRPILTEPVKDLAGRADGTSDYGRVISSVSDAAIKCSSRQQGSRILLACANTTNTEKSVTISMASSIPGKVVRAWDNSVIEPSGAAFSDTFKGLLDATARGDSVHVYLIETQPAGMAIRSVQ